MYPWNSIRDFISSVSFSFTIAYKVTIINSGEELFKITELICLWLLGVEIVGKHKLLFAFRGVGPENQHFWAK